MIYDPPARVGQNIDDYVVERLIGRGGMSVVFFARNQITGLEAAIKILDGDLPDNIEAERRLQQEARAIERIEHPNVVRMFGYGRTPDGLPYFAMEYLEGESLTQRLIGGRALPPTEILPIVLQMLAGLGEAHKLDIIHRDIKPDNVFLLNEPNGQVKMLDFGIAKLLGTQPHSLVETVRGVVLGTPEYLPPEIAMDLAVSPATDIYAVGVILFEALTGRLPFSGRGPAEMAEHHCFTPPPRLRTFNRDIPRALENVVLRCLAKDAPERYQSAAELTKALQPFLDIVAGPSPTLVSGAIESDTSQAFDLDEIERTLRDQLAVRWIDRTLPAVLTRGLGEVDAGRRALEAVGTELAIVRDQLAQAPQSISDLEAALEEVNNEEERLAEETFRLHEKLRHASGRLEHTGESAESLLSEILKVDVNNTTDGLQAILSQAFLDRIAGQLQREEEIARTEAEQRGILETLSEVASTRSRVVAQRAELEAEILGVQAEHTAARLRLLARRDSLDIQVGASRRSLAHSLARLALDIAVAVGQ